MIIGDRLNPVGRLTNKQFEWKFSIPRIHIISSICEFWDKIFLAHNNLASIIIEFCTSIVISVLSSILRSSFNYKLKCLFVSSTFSYLTKPNNMKRYSWRTFTSVEWLKTMYANTFIYVHKVWRHFEVLNFKLKFDNQDDKPDEEINTSEQWLQNLKKKK